MLGPQSERNSDHIKAICDNMEIPYIETRPALTERRGHLSSINLHPDPDKLGDILGIKHFIKFGRSLNTIISVKLIERYGWSQVILLYEDNYALRSLQPLLDVTAKSGGQFQIITRQLVLDREEGYRPVLKDIYNIKGKHIVLACKKRILTEVLNQAQQIGNSIIKNRCIISENHI